MFGRRPSPLIPGGCQISRRVWHQSLIGCRHASPAAASSPLAAVPTDHQRLLSVELRRRRRRVVMLVVVVLLLAVVEVVP